MRQVVKADRSAASNGRQRVIGDSDGDAELLVHQLVESAQQRSAAGQDEAVIDDVADQFRLALGDAVLDAVQDRGDWLTQGLADFLAGHNGFARHSADRVEAADFHRQLLFERIRAADLDFDFLGRRRADAE